MLIKRITDQKIIKTFITSPEIWELIAEDHQNKEDILSRTVDTEAEIHLGWFTEPSGQLASAEEGELIGLLIAHKTAMSTIYKALEVHLNVLPEYSKEAHKFTAEAQKLLSEITDYLYCEVPEDSRVQRFIEKDQFIFKGTSGDRFKKNSIDLAMRCYVKKLK